MTRTRAGRRGRHQLAAAGTWLVLGAACLASGCSRALLGTLNLVDGSPPRPVETRVYDPAHGLQLDLYRPRSPATDAPVVVFFHGGRWQTGDRRQYAFVGHALAERGILAVIPQYRTWPEAGFPAFVEDAAAATAWAFRHVGGLGGDAQRIVVSGHSAGAHIAALLATDARYLGAHALAPTALAGFAGVAGPYDFLPLDSDDLRAIFAPREQWPASQPVNFVDGDEPPMLLLHGSDDRSVHPRNAERLAGRAGAVGVPVEVRRYAGVGHVRILLAMAWPSLAPTLQDLAAFARATAPRELPGS